MKPSSIRRILVPLDPSEYTKAATSLACLVAKHHETQLEGLAVVDTPTVRAQVAPVDMMHWALVAEAVSAAESSARESMAEARRKFAQECEARGAWHHESQMDGLPASHVLQMSALHDLVVMGMQTHFHHEVHGVGDSLAKVLDRTVTPVLAVPRTPPEKIEHAVVAYDGSFAAARALRDFIEFAKPFDLRVTVLSAHENEDHVQQLLKQAVACFEAHGLTEVRTVASDKSAISALYEDGLIDGADLMVAGIHAQKFIKDAFVGSFVNELIQRGDTALYLSH
ncbi:MAG: universal stress protein [Verrucomicrobiota bacterium]